MFVVDLVYNNNHIGQIYVVFLKHKAENYGPVKMLGKMLSGISAAVCFEFKFRFG